MYGYVLPLIVHYRMMMFVIICSIHHCWISFILSVFFWMLSIDNVNMNRYTVNGLQPYEMSVQGHYIVPYLDSILEMASIRNNRNTVGIEANGNQSNDELVMKMENLNE